MKIKNGLVKCPRCNEKNLASQKKCGACGFVFERLNYCSNKSAKKEVIKFHKNNYFMCKEWPEDVSKKKALLLCGFLGMLGAHNFYLGRFFKAAFVLFGIICAALMVILPYGSTSYNIISYIGTLPGALVLFFWVFDFINIFLERYRIPVSINKQLYDLKKGIISEDGK